MRCLIALLGVFLISCAHQIEREIASTKDPVVLGMVDLKHTEIRYFPPETADHDNVHVFYLTTRDWQKRPVDLDPSEFGVFFRKKQLAHALDRVAQGRYTITFKNEGLDHTALKLQGKRLKLLMENEKQLPVLKKSSVEIVSNEQNLLVIHITLRDKKGELVGLIDLPEIIPSEYLVIREVRMVKTGVWEVTMSYPEENFILYLSVRANGVYLNKLFRYQHIEKAGHQ